MIEVRIDPVFDGSEFLIVEQTESGASRVIRFARSIRLCSCCSMQRCRRGGEVADVEKTMAAC